ncbi:MAG: 2-C-methyl-D-erythritol 4-phosphate cytidylyltransferase [Deltaproteobacteria bacterium]|jgi:2-C-methyl-D-erythritol 4-phosphate cytidylyltransferase/2-C-methyl-D-erythritol 2,4-cyclodiphosphate synthase|nr:2-C-methyl-D-erythritol 4-phosphate cytidylyltransferase [Deltaproteobacteria bacterium]
MPSFLTSVIIVAAGKGTRFKAGSEARPKQLMPLLRQSVIETSAELFESNHGVNEIVVAAPRDWLTEFEALFETWPKIKVIIGGESRAQSTLRALREVNPQSEVVLVHDGVRPLVSRYVVDEVINKAYQFGAAIAAVRVSDTLKLSDKDLNVLKTVDRTCLWRAQTPQGFRKNILVRALQSRSLESATDEASLVEALGLPVKLVESSVTNLKITRLEDLTLARVLATMIKSTGIESRGDNWTKASPLAQEATESLREDESNNRATSFFDPTRLRVGQGWDFHRLDSTRSLWLGGVFIENLPGLAGHSDADVLIHALIDAILGAAGLGDIGQMFPPTQERWRGACGVDLLAMAFNKVKSCGYALVNADLTLIGPSPKISDYGEAMIESMAKAMGQENSLFNLKGKTTEGLGFVGRGEGLAAAATVLLVRVS